VLVEEQQRMAKRIEELEAMLEQQTARIVDLQTHIENFDGDDR
jgi:cell division protein FtsB